MTAWITNNAKRKRLFSNVLPQHVSSSSNKSLINSNGMQLISDNDNMLV